MGELDGILEQYWVNGKLFVKVKYKDGLKEGKEKVFWEYGKQQSIISYKKAKCMDLMQSITRMENFITDKKWKRMYSQKV